MGDVIDREPIGRLLAMSLSAVVTDLHAGLEARGFGDIRPLWGFVLVSVADRPRTIGELGEILGVSKQAAAKAVAGLAETGLASTADDPRDRRATLVSVAERGRAFLSAAEEAYVEIEAEWADVIGQTRLEELRRTLAESLSARFGDEPPPLRPAL